MTHTSPSISQTGFRARENSGAEASPTWIAAVDTNWTQDTGSSFRVRFEITEGNGANEPVNPEIWYSLNGGTWTAVGTTTPIQFATLVGTADATATTQQLGGGGSFVAGEVTQDATWASPNLNGQITELEVCLTIDAAQVADADTIGLRIYNSGSVLSGSYTQQPTITVNEVAAPDALLADDVQSTTQTGTPALGQTHALTATSAQSTTQVSAPVFGAGYILTDDDDATLTDDGDLPLLGSAQGVAPDNLLADDVQSATEATTPAVGQAHVLDATDAEAATEASQPAVGQAHVLTATSVESATEAGSPALGQIHVLSAAGVESATDVSNPSVTESNVLDAADIQSSAEVSAPIFGAGYALTDDDDAILTDDDDLPLLGSNAASTVDVLAATSIESATEVTAPGITTLGLTAVLDTGPEPDELNYTLNDTWTGTLYWRLDVSGSLTPAQIEAGGGEASGSVAVTSGSGSDTIDLTAEPSGSYTLHSVFKRTSDGAYSNVVTQAITLTNLTATSIEAATEVSAPALASVGEDALLADDIESASEVTAPVMGQVHMLLAEDAAAASEVSVPAFTQGHALAADDAESATEVDQPTMGQVHVLFQNGVQSATETSAPALAEGTSNLTPEDLEAATEVSEGVLGQGHVLTVASVQSASEVTSPVLRIAGAIVGYTPSEGILKISAKRDILRIETQDKPTRIRASNG